MILCPPKSFRRFRKRTSCQAMPITPLGIVCKPVTLQNMLNAQPQASFSYVCMTKASKQERYDEYWVESSSSIRSQKNNSCL